jgi:hypothetical protein
MLTKWLEKTNNIFYVKVNQNNLYFPFLVPDHQAVNIVVLFYRAIRRLKYYGLTAKKVSMLHALLILFKNEILPYLHLEGVDPCCFFAVLLTVQQIFLLFTFSVFYSLICKSVLFSLSIYLHPLDLCLLFLLTVLLQCKIEDL